MRSRILAGLLMVVACDLSLLVAASRAQQAPRPASGSRTRSGYYSRVQSEGDATATTGGGRVRSRFETDRSLDGPGESSRASLRGDLDPLRPYSSGNGRLGDKPRPYERTPVVSPPERTTPPPPVSHNYFPGLRTGQGPNHNMVSHCVPGRHAFLHR